MNKPDFSQSPEHVALAKVLHEANPSWNHMQWEDLARPAQRSFLAMAEAAITFFGSGYRLPPANEANAERLAKTMWPESTDYFETRERIDRAFRWLCALHTAFPEPAEKPEKPCNCADCSPASWPEANGWRCGKKKPEPCPAPEPNCGDILDSEARIKDTRPESEVRLSALGFKYAYLVLQDANSPSDAVQILCSAAGKLPKGEPTVANNATVAPDPDSPDDPTFCRPGCDRPFGHLGECGNDAADFAAEVAEVERQRLLEAFMHDMVSNSAVMAKMLENYEADEDAIAARLHEIALAFTQELIG